MEKKNCCVIGEKWKEIHGVTGDKSKKKNFNMLKMAKTLYFHHHAILVHSFWPEEIAWTDIHKTNGQTLTE